VQAAPVLPPPPPAPAVPAAPTSEALFNDAIRRAVETGDIDRALKLLEEAERLGSPSARPTFIEAIQSRGN
jgi:maltose operon protein